MSNFDFEFQILILNSEFWFKISNADFEFRIVILKFKRVWAPKAWYQSEY